MKIKWRDWLQEKRSEFNIEFSNSFLCLLMRFSDKRVEFYGANYFAFGFFGSIVYAMLFFLQQKHSSYFFLNAIIRAIALIIVIITLIYPAWKESLRRYFAFFWHITLVYCLVLLPVYCTLQDHVSSLWLTNLLLGFFLLSILADWLTFVILLILGSAAGVAIFHYIYGLESCHTENFWILAYLYVFVIVIVVIFLSQKNKMNNEKLSALKFATNIVANELGSPVADMEMEANVILKKIDAIIGTLAKTPEFEAPKAQLDLLKNECANMAKISVDTKNKMSFLVNNLDVLNNNASTINLTNVSAIQCINLALSHPFLSDADREKISFNEPIIDINIKGDRYLIMNAILNLIIKLLDDANQESRIQIYTNFYYDNAAIYIKGAPSKISAKDETDIFEKLNSSENCALGVAICATKKIMDMIGGSVGLNNLNNEYAEFALNFNTIHD
ncbi:MAG: hypothetical protein LBI30_00675 [Holosporales bacterium]|jgi:hypothetical protein|nr:hypothetical protein [Holosporales bacterium]